MKKYVISGLPPGKSGLGRFLTRLAQTAENSGWEVLWRPQRGQGRPARYALKMILFIARLRFIRNTDVLVLHPQSLRWGTFFRIMVSNRVRLYVVDNSFFCIRSYNYRGARWGECLDCLGDLSRCHVSCQPFPVSYQRVKNMEYLRKLKEKAPGIIFIVQNPGQGRLVQEHFGKDIVIRPGGMMTGEFERVERGGSDTKTCDVVFHGALNEAKGAAYAIELARRLPELSFLMPGRPEDALDLSGESGLPDNVEVADVSWETGLKEHVENCRLVLCPSLWSAPIEGALVKSILHNGRVAVFNSRYGYQADLAADLVIRLDPDIEKAAGQIREGIELPVDGALAKVWFDEFRSSADLEAAFR